MNKQPIERASDTDLRLSPQAMQRAAQRARELAARTGTSIVVSLDGVIQHIRPRQETVASAVQEPPALFGNEP